MTPARKEPDASTYAGRFAIRLKLLREKAKLTHKEIAEKIGVTVTTYYRWESSENFPKADQFPLLADALGLKTVRVLFPEK